jgi:hypothetical protein
VNRFILVTVKVKLPVTDLANWDDPDSGPATDVRTAALYQQKWYEDGSVDLIETIAMADKENIEVSCHGFDLPVVPEVPTPAQRAMLAANAPGKAPGRPVDGLGPAIPAEPPGAVPAPPPEADGSPGRQP